MQEIAKMRGGRCLSEKYVNNHTKLVWECKYGHRWQAKPALIKQQTWCPICAKNRKFTIGEMKIIAKRLGGKCLSEDYVNSSTKLLWECSEGHRWEAIPYTIKKGSWCPYCAGSGKLTIEGMREIAKQRGGKCLSNKYVNNQTKLLWECAEGHQWEAIPNRIKMGTWCPICSSGLGERIAREYFEQIFEKKFPKTRPHWLINERGNRMELDGFCPSLGLAFEHQGKQHYSANNNFGSPDHEIEKIQKDDDCKIRKCAENGVVLFQIPEIPTMLHIDEIKRFIEEICLLNGIDLPYDFHGKIVALKNAYVTSHLKKAFNELKLVCRNRGGKCLSKYYTNSKTKLSFECYKGHRWETTPDSINSGQWCPLCGKEKSARTRRSDISEIKEIALARGGRCLSREYKDSKQKLLWACKEGHQWEARLPDIKSGNWCPFCAGKMKLTIEEMHEMAEKRNGKCISINYTNSQTKLVWECSMGHQWEATPNKIKGGNWCPICAVDRKAQDRRLGIEQMKDIARNLGGKCLSSKYLNAQSKLKWECSKGHRWIAIPNSIKRGHWCPVCAGAKRAENKKLSIKEMKEVANAKGGKCISKTYVNARNNLLWECEFGHRWEAKPYNIKAGKWCPECYRLKQKASHIRN